MRAHGSVHRHADRAHHPIDDGRRRSEAAIAASGDQLEAAGAPRDRQFRLTFVAHDYFKQQHGGSSSDVFDIAGHIGPRTTCIALYDCVSSCVREPQRRRGRP